MKALLFTLGLCLFSPSGSGQEGGDPLDDLRKQRDEATAEVLEALRLEGSKETLDGVMEVYGKLDTTYMRIQLLSVISAYDGLDGNATLAAEFIASEVANTTDLDVREAALAALSGCNRSGPAALRRLVETPIETEVRERCLGLYIEMAPGDDKQFLMGIYLLPNMLERAEAAKDKKKKKKAKRSKKKKNDEEEDTGPKIPRNTTHMRRMALQAVWSRLDVKELKAYLPKEPDRKNYITLLRALDEKRDPEAQKRALEVLGQNRLPGEIRSAAAEIMVAHKGSEMISAFMDIAKSKATTPATLYWTMARLIRDMPAEDTSKALESRMSKAKGKELIFLLDAMPVPVPEKINRKAAKGLKSKVPTERIAVIRFLARSKGEGNAKSLSKLVKSEKELHVKGALLEALSKLNESNPEWMETLFEYSDSKDGDLRHAARLEILRLARPADFDHWVAWLSDANWSIRQAALIAMENSHELKILAPIVERMPEENGRLLFEFGEVLFRLTGKDFGDNATQWGAWFAEEGDSVALLSKSELEEAKRERVLKAQKQRSRVPRFFGIEIRSERVIFIVDISGSMEEMLKGQYVNQKGEKRMDRAKAELAKAVESLTPGTLFNILAFSSDVEPWSEKGLAETPEPNREEALDWISDLKAFGGTNLHGSLIEALDDPDVDTILVLSDGLPSVGDLIDPGEIREDIATRNIERNIKIHTISLGGSLQVLEWLAEDSGGAYTHME